MPTYHVPEDGAYRYVTVVTSPGVPQGVIIGASDLVQYAVVLGHAALSQLSPVVDLKTRIYVHDTVTNRSVGAGQLSTQGVPHWDGHPVVVPS